MFSPHYTITEKLLSQIKKIATLVSELNHQRFPEVVQMTFERHAKEVSSYASTSIEGNPLPLTEVKKILKSHPLQARQSEREVLNYNQALEGLNRQIKRGQVNFDLQLILTIHRQIMDKLLLDSQIGKLRSDSVFVNDPKTGRPMYLPPDVKDVARLMEELITFIRTNKGSIDPLMLSGIFHKQFVIIHPFLDGNGRTARLATKVLLSEMGLDTFHLFSFENYYNTNVTRYFQTVGVLGNYYEIADKIDFTPWLEYFTEGIIDELLRVEKLLQGKVVSPVTELKSHHRKILEVIEEKGFVTDRDYKEVIDRAKATRRLDFAYLIKLGLIQRKGKGKATYYELKNVR